jgi:type II secretory pathway pseudopilin PulG
MKPVIVLLALAAAASPALGQQYTERERQQIEDAQKEQALRARQDSERRIQRARENCLANRGVDCDSPQGLQEWLILERSRAEAVLDRVIPGSSSGASSPQPSGAR